MVNTYSSMIPYPFLEEYKAQQIFIHMKSTYPKIRGPLSMESIKNEYRRMRSKT